MRLSITDMFVNRARFWNVRATPSSAVSAGRRSSNSTPSSRADPLCGRYTAFRQLNIDVLPAPLGPMTANSSPGRTSKLTSRSATTPPNVSETSSTSRSGVGETGSVGSPHHELHCFWRR